MIEMNNKIRKILRTFILSFPNEHYTGLFISELFDYDKWSDTINVIKYIYGYASFSTNKMFRQKLMTVVDIWKCKNAKGLKISDESMHFDIGEYTWTIDNINKRIYLDESRSDIPSMDYQFKELPDHVLATFFAMILMHRDTDENMIRFSNDMSKKGMWRIKGSRPID